MSILMLYIALACCFGGLIIMAWQQRSRLTEFHIALLFFSISIALCIRPLLSTDPFGRTHYDPIKVSVALAILVSVVIIALAGSTLPLNHSEQSHTPVDYKRLSGRVKLLMLGCFIVASFVLIVMTWRLGNLPLFALAQGDNYGRLVYGNVYTGFFSAVGRGASRAGIFLCVVFYLWSGCSVIKFLRTNITLIVSGLGCILIASVDGQRSQLIFPLMASLLGFSAMGRLSLKWAAVTGIGFMIFIVVVGQFRTMYQQGEVELSFTTGSSMLNLLLGWIIRYTEPVIYNLNNLVTIGVPPALGRVWFADFVPDGIFYKFVDYAPSAPAILAQARLYAQPGLTLRTALADFYVDFGLVGAVVVLGGLVNLSRILYTRARNSPRALWFYMCISYTIFYMPLMNVAGGIPFLLPIIVGFLLPRRMLLPFPSSKNLRK